MNIALGRLVGIGRRGKKGTASPKATSVIKQPSREVWKNFKELRKYQYIHSFRVQKICKLFIFERNITKAKTDIFIEKYVWLGTQLTHTCENRGKRRVDFY